MRIRPRIGWWAACLLTTAAIPVLAQAPQEPAKLAPPPMIVNLLQGGNQDPKQAERRELSWEDLREAADVEPMAADKNPPPAPPLNQDAADLVAKSEQAIGKGEVYRAIELLRRADALTPKHPVITRLLGISYAVSGNRTRASAYLQRAVTRDPADAVTLTLLAQHAIDTGKLGPCIVYCEALGKAGVPALADYFLYESLHRRGYEFAAAQRLASALDASAGMDLKKIDEAGKTDPIVVRELRVLAGTSAVLRLRAGDTLLTHGEVKKAAEQYAKVDTAALADPGEIVARRVYLDLLQGNPTAALDRVIDLLAGPKATADHGKLVAYLAEQGVPAAQLADRFVAEIDVRGGSFGLLAGLVRIPDKGRVVEVIIGQSKKQPGKGDELGRVVGLIPFEDSAQADAQPVSKLLAFVADQMRRDPEQAIPYARAVLKDFEARVCLLRAVRLPEYRGAKDDAYRALLAALVYTHAGRDIDAITQYRLAYSLDGRVAEMTRTPLAELLVDHDEAKAALDLVGEVGPDSAWVRVAIAARATAELDVPAAIKLVQAWTSEQGDTTASSMLRIELIAQHDGIETALNQLYELLDAQPKEVALYRLGFDLLDQYEDEFRDRNTYFRLYEQLQRRLRQRLPESALSLVMLAEFDYLDEDRSEQVERMLLMAVEKEPANAEAWHMLSELYELRGDTQAQDKAYDRYVAALPMGLPRIIARASRDVQRGDMKTVKRDMESVIAYEQQGVLPGAPLDGDSAISVLALIDAADPEADRSELMLKWASRFPDNASMNNGVGYTLAMQGKHLLQAKAMIQRAVEAEPEQYEYLDSLAWVQYKLGDFKNARANQLKAMRELDAKEKQYIRMHKHSNAIPQTVKDRYEASLRSSRAVFLDHLGDIFYKSNQLPAAKKYWQEASELSFSQEAMNRSPELRTMGKRLAGKLAAAQAGKPVPVSPVPGPEAHGPDGHPADLVKAAEDAGKPAE